MTDVQKGQRRMLKQLLKAVWNVLRGKSGVYSLVYSTDESPRVEGTTFAYSGDAATVLSAVQKVNQQAERLNRHMEKFLAEEVGEEAASRMMRWVKPKKTSNL